MNQERAVRGIIQRTLSIDSWRYAAAMFVRLAIIAAGCLLCLASMARAQSPPEATELTSPPPNFPTATLGGNTFWTDELVHGDWRIQQNVLSGHYRLLDDRDFRRAWGTFDQCKARFDELKREQSLPTPRGHAVITLHGIIRSRDQMEGLGKYLADKGDYTWINVSYASTRASLDEHAHALARVIENLPEVERIDLVCHSMGNLVVRRYLGEAEQPEPRWTPDPRIGRMVMLGPPNNGAEMARFFKDNQLYSVVTGPSGQQLCCGWQDSHKLLATPKFEFGIIAGGAGNGRGFNPLVKGDDDLVVAVEETRLPGARDFCVVDSRHGWLMDEAQVRRRTLKFLQEGHFTTEEARQPIAADSNAAAGAAGP